MDCVFSGRFIQQLFDRARAVHTFGPVRLLFEMPEGLVEDSIPRFDASRGLGPRPLCVLKRQTFLFQRFEAGDVRHGRVARVFEQQLGVGARAFGPECGVWERCR